MSKVEKEKQTQKKIFEVDMIKKKKLIFKSSQEGKTEISEEGRKDEKGRRNLSFKM